MNKFNEARMKKQKETHSEIERKRRERMKRETAFLSTQLTDKTIRKDKLSIYRAGAEQLLNYTVNLGKREFILNDFEYSAIILNNYDGLALHILCSDGEVLWCNEKFKSVLGLDDGLVVGTPIQQICEPSYETEKIIEKNLSIDDDEKDLLKNGELITRNFVVGMKMANNNMYIRNCTRGFDGKWYRFIELCGDICINTETSEDDFEASLIYRCLGRTLELSSNLDPSCVTFTIKVDPESNVVFEVVGNINEALGINASELLDQELTEFVVEEEKIYMTESLKECVSKSTVNLLLNLFSPNRRKNIFSVTLNYMIIDKKNAFIIGTFTLYSSKISESELQNDLKFEKLQIDQVDRGSSKENKKPVMFDIPECFVAPERKNSFLNKPEKSKSGNSIETEAVKEEDCDSLPNNDSFKSLLGDCCELFKPESIQELVSEDINDIKCEYELN